MILETGLPNESCMAVGLKEGSYWETIATKYVNGPPGPSMVKAIYNVWQTRSFVKLVEEKLHATVGYETFFFLHYE